MAANIKLYANSQLTSLEWFEEEPRELSFFINHQHGVNRRLSFFLANVYTHTEIKANTYTYTYAYILHTYLCIRFTLHATIPTMTEKKVQWKLLVFVWNHNSSKNNSNNTLTTATDDHKQSQKEEFYSETLAKAMTTTYGHFNSHLSTLHALVRRVCVWHKCGFGLFY